MDVRCDRCQTEYELEDASVAEGGASVQCTSCGHTFVVTRGRNLRTPTPPPVPTDAGGPPSWMLTTEEGKAHRFRDPTTLQKWIVERRVGRADRVCPPGGSWRRLGDMDELRPFFEIVEQADRKAAAARGARPTTPETPGRRIAAAKPPGPAYASEPYASIDDDDDDVLTTGRRSGGGRAAGGMQGQGRVSNRLDSEVTAGLVTSDGRDDSLSMILPARRNGPKLAAGVLILGLVAGAAYLGYNGGFASHRGSEAAASAPAPAPAAAAPPAPPLPPPVAVAPPAAAAPPAPPAAAPVPTPPPPPVAAAPPAAAVAPPAPPPTSRGRPPPAPPRAGAGPSPAARRSTVGPPPPRTCRFTGAATNSSSRRAIGRSRTETPPRRKRPSTRPSSCSPTAWPR